MNHILCDIDRDGWGSAALVIAQRGPADCRLYPVVGKAVVNTLAGLKTTPGDTIWVLDLPWPGKFDVPCTSPDVQVVWVDHHSLGLPADLPVNMRLVLPATSRPTTTMSLLLANGLASPPHAWDFVRSLCCLGGDCPWGLVFDGLRAAAPDFPVQLGELVSLLAEGPLGRNVPTPLQALISVASGQRAVVEKILDQANWEVGEHLVVVYIADAHGIALAQYCLAARLRQPDKMIAIVHRSSTLYCGRDSQGHGLDLIRHFRNRQLDPKGHPYVCFVHLPKDRVVAELAALRATLASADK